VGVFGTIVIVIVVLGSILYRIDHVKITPTRKKPHRTPQKIKDKTSTNGNGSHKDWDDWIPG
jgi:hypothetical protein